jgi:hypothetical protein
MAAITVIAIVFMGGCKSKKAIVKRHVQIRPDNELIRSIISDQDHKTGWEIKMMIKVELNGDEFKGVATVRFGEKNTVWASVRAGIGIEVARIFANRDSVWVYSRIMKVQEKGDWNYLYKLTGIKINAVLLKGLLTRTLINQDNNKKELTDQWVIEQTKDKTWLRVAVSQPEEIGYITKYRIENIKPFIKETDVLDVKGLWNLRMNYYGSDKKRIEKINFTGIDSNNRIEGTLNYLMIQKKMHVEMPFNRF